MVICTMPGCQTTAGCVCGMAGLRPRWIADDPEKILYERMEDGSYKPIYKMVPIDLSKFKIVPVRVTITFIA